MPAGTSNQALLFGELLAGGVLLVAGITGSSVPDVFAGRAHGKKPLIGDLPSHPGTSSTPAQNSTGVEGVGTSTHGLQPQVIAALAYARAHGWHGTVTSGWRSFAEQARLHAACLAGTGSCPAAAPGQSQHEKGLAVDVTDRDTFARIMASAPPSIRLIPLPGDPPHFSTSGF